MRKHPDSDILARAMRRALEHARPWGGEAFRAASVRYANRDDLLTGFGARSAGGRWNPPGSFATVYLGLTPETALAEYLAQHRFYGWPVSSAMPYVSVGIRVTLRSVLDLTAGPVRKSLGVSLARMRDDGWRKAEARESLTQAIGRLAFEAGTEALVVPSSADRKGANLVVLPGNLRAPGSRLRIVNRDQLPPPPGS